MTETKLSFTAKELNKIQVVAQEVDIVTYTIGEETYYDAVRGYTMVDIFDAYYDKLKGTGTISKIKSGYGNIRPNLYGKIKTDEES